MLPRWHDVVEDKAGNALAGVRVAVTTWKGDVPTLYGDRLGASSLTTNVLTTNSRGGYAFFAPAGNYILTTTAPTGYVSDTREITLGSGDSLNPEWFGIFPGAGGDISAAMQAWVNEIIQDDASNPGNGDRRAGVIQLPWLNGATMSGVYGHPAVSILGNVQGGTRLRLTAHAQPVGLEAQRCMLYVVARARTGVAAGTWMPEIFSNVFADGQKLNQDGNETKGLYFEKGLMDPYYRFWTPTGSANCYSACTMRNGVFDKFSGTAVDVRPDRQRLTLLGRCKATNGGLLNPDGSVLVAANGIHIAANDPVISQFGGGGHTASTLLLSDCSGLLLTDSNVWGPESTARSNSAVAIQMQNCNGWGIKNNVIQDTVSLVGGLTNDDRNVEFSGNHLKPSKQTFVSDGVPIGTADASFNAHVRVSGYPNIDIGANSFNTEARGSRFLNLLTVCNDGHAYAKFSSTSFEDRAADPPRYVKPWAAAVDVPIAVFDSSTCCYEFTDIDKQTTFFNVGRAPTDGANQVFHVSVGEGATIIIGSAEMETLVTKTGGADAITIQLPYPPRPGVPYGVAAPDQFTSVSLVLAAAAVTDGQTLKVEAQTALPAGGHFRLIYRAASKTWWPAP